MPIYNAPVSDTRFILDYVVELDKYAGLSGFDRADKELVDAVLEGAAQLASEVLAPLNMVGDEQGCVRHADGSVTTPDGFKAAYDAYVQGGWTTMGAPEEYGGQALPHVVVAAVGEYILSANQAFETYVGLTAAAVSALLVSGSEEQKATYVPKMVAGIWSGTMNLTEPQCGTDLSLVRTRAVPVQDGSFRITGTKMFITAGEHDLSENIIHLVLAKTPGAPDGAKGLSLFLVPKFLVNPDGSVGDRNTVSCGSIEHKMGLRGSATCVMNYDEAHGWLVGSEGGGLRAMFVMMNLARLTSGMQGLAQAENAYQNAVAYARERRQGRALTGPKDINEKADLLLVHPDVRRLLLESKALTEGMRALCLWGALQVDLARVAETEQERESAHDLISLLTPVIKAFCTDRGLETTINCQQVWGGHGYICENGVEQFVRDVRIAQVWEGANGVQAMDLLVRKLPMKGGKVVQRFFDMISEEVAASRDSTALAPLSTALEQGLADLNAATAWLAKHGRVDPNNLGAGGLAYLHMMGIVVVGLMWLRMARAAATGIAEDSGERAFLEAKLLTATFYGERFLPETLSLRRRVEAGAGTLMAMPDESF